MRDRGHSKGHEHIIRSSKVHSSLHPHIVTYAGTWTVLLAVSYITIAWLFLVGQGRPRPQHRQEATVWKGLQTIRAHVVWRWQGSAESPPHAAAYWALPPGTGAAGAAGCRATWHRTGEGEKKVGTGFGDQSAGLMMRPGAR